MKGMVKSMLIVELILISVGAYLCLVTGWLILLTLASWCYREKTDRNAPPLFLGVVIPAHDEASGIGETVGAVLGCDYPKDRMKIMVIADHCTDDTAGIARRAGAVVFVREGSEERGKGRALDWFLRECRGAFRDLDALVFVDADARVDRRMLRELSASLSHPDVSVVQGFNGVANPLENWRTALNTAAFNVFNHLRMAGNGRLFGTAMLKGLGMGMRTEVLTAHGWPAHSPVEDMEYSLLLLEKNVGIHYNPRAVITSKMEGKRSAADAQRRRWEGGRMALVPKMLPGLFKTMIAGKPGALYAVMDLLIPPLSLLVGLLLVWTIGVVLAMPDFSQVCPILLGGIVFYVISGQLQRGAEPALWFYLCATPAFIAWKLGLLFGRELGGAKWERKRRGNAKG